MKSWLCVVSGCDLVLSNQSHLSRCAVSKVTPFVSVFIIGSSLVTVVCGLLKFGDQTWVVED